MNGQASCVDEVIINGELGRRPSRPPDFEAENRALVSLAGVMAESPGKLFQELAGTALKLRHADSAGISLLESERGEEIVRWQAAVGGYASHVGTTMRRDSSPCGAALDRNATILMADPARFYPRIADLSQPAAEMLLIPFYRGEDPIGTIWAVAHSGARRFDSEDVRVMKGLSRFASAAALTLKNKESIARSEERFRALVTASSYVVYRMNPDWSEMRHLVGREFVPDTHEPSRTWLEKYIEPEDRPRVQETIREAIRTRGMFELEHRVRCIGDSRGWISSRAVPILDPGGDVIEWFGMASDITEKKRAEEELTRRVRELQAIFDTAPVGINIAEDPGCTVIRGNHVISQMLGMGIGENLSKTGPATEKATYTVLERGKELAPDELPMQRAAAGGVEIWDQLLEIVKADGSRIAAVVNAKPIRDEDGEIRGAVGVCIDVTERQRTEEMLRASEERLRLSEERYRLLAEANPIGIIHATSTGAVRFCNEAYSKITGYTREDFESGHVGWRDITPPEWIAVDEAHIEGARRKGFSEAYEKEYVRKDGSRVPVIVGYALFGEGRSQASAFILDISAQKRAEAEREQLVQRLRDADRKKDEFLAMLAHELRNPLAAIGNAATVLKHSTDPANVDFAKEIIDRQTQQFARLIDDLLDISRINSGKIRLQREPCDAGTILRQAIESAGPLIEERGHRLDMNFPDGDLPLQGDATRLEQIFVNLLTNAAKYTESNGRIEIDARRDRDEIVVAVRDNGIGISPEKLPQMFELFAQGERSIDRSEGGLGIGLTIVQKLAEMHGGGVTAESKGLGQGSTFTIRLPAATQAAEAEAKSASPAQASARGYRILVVDDNKDMSRGLATLLRLHGNEVVVTHDGLSAIDMARSFGPEFILLDIGLPGMDGYEVARMLRDEPGGMRSVIIAITGYGQEDDRRRSREAGFDHHLVKPVEFSKLISLLASPPG